jgi:hypothetical protein
MIRRSPTTIFDGALLGGLILAVAASCAPDAKPATSGSGGGAGAAGGGHGGSAGASSGAAGGGPTCLSCREAMVQGAKSVTFGSGGSGPMYCSAADENVQLALSDCIDKNCNMMACPGAALYGCATWEMGSCGSCIQQSCKSELHNCGFMTAVCN